MAEDYGSRSFKFGSLTFLAIVGGFLAAFLLFPVLYAFQEAFWINGHFSLEYFRLILKNPVYSGAIVNSLMLGLATTVATTLVAVPLAFVGARYSFRGKGILTSLLLVPMIMPPFVGAIGMRQLLSYDGAVNQLLGLVGIPRVPFLSEGGFISIVILEVLHLYPIMYLNVAAALANVDPSLEEAARNMGDSGFRLFRKVTFPLMLPGYFAGAVLVFIWAFTDLGTPLIFEFNRVVAVQIFNGVNDPDSNQMGHAFVVLVIVLSAAAFLAGKYYVGRGGYEMLSKGVSARREKPLSRRATLLMWTGMAGLLALAVLPHLSVIVTSLAAVGSWSGSVLPTQWTLEHYSQALNNELAVAGIRNSLMLSLVSTAVDVVLGIGIAYILVRRRFVGVEFLDALVMMPLALPGLVLAFGYVTCFRGTPIDPRVNPFPLLIIAYSVRRLPYMVRAAYAGFQQTSVTLEEAAMNVGASPRQAVLKITVPLIMANLIAGAILSFSFAMLEVSDSLILAATRKDYPLTKAIYVIHSDPVTGHYVASALGVFAMFLLAATLVISGLLLGKKMGQLFRV